MNYESIIILGTGRLAFQFAKKVQDFDIPVVVYDTNQTKSSLLRQSLQNRGIVCKRVTIENISHDLRNIHDETLLISAINPYLIPKTVLENPNLLAINCHYALLPKHPGRNAEAWAIYEQDHKTGITWHLMTSDIDAGDIIAQKEFPIEEAHTSLGLLRVLNQLAFQTFSEFLPSLMKNDITCSPQNEQLKGKTHYSWEKPNGGYLDLDWSPNKISAFLRSMDYGIVELMGKPKLILDDKCYKWKNYKIKKYIQSTDTDKVQISGSSIIINKGIYQFTLHQYYQETQKSIQQRNY